MVGNRTAVISRHADPIIQFNALKAGNMSG
jgi:hypothetical protein